MEFTQLFGVIAENSFPIVVAVWLLYTTNKDTKQNTLVLNKLISTVEYNTETIKQLICDKEHK